MRIKIEVEGMPDSFRRVGKREAIMTRRTLQKNVELISMDNNNSPDRSVVLSPLDTQTETLDSERKLEKHYCVNSDFLLREIAGESILIPVGEASVAGNCIISLNETASFLWKQYQTPKAVRDVVQAATGVYADSAGKLEQDICEYTAKFLQVGLLQEVE